MSQQIVIIGLGQFGMALARRLAEKAQRYLLLIETVIW